MKIVQYPHPALRRVARPLTAIDKQVRMHAAEMLELMYAHKGLGLAANQVALPYQLLVLNFTGDPEQQRQRRRLYQPRHSRPQRAPSRARKALELPELFQKIRRAKTVSVQAYNLKGEVVEKVTSAIWKPVCGSTKSITSTASCSSTKWVPSPSSPAAAQLKEFEQDFQRGQEKGEIPTMADLERLLREASRRAGEKRYAAIGRCSTLFDPWNIVIMRLVMMGTGLFAEPTLEALLAGPHPVVGLVTQPDRGRRRRARIDTTDRPRHEEHRPGTSHPGPATGEHQHPRRHPRATRASQPDLLVVAAYGQILSREVLTVPPHGGINVHASLLPKYRGATPIAWAIYHGGRDSGVTLIRMSVSLNAGDMFAQEAPRHRPGGNDGRSGSADSRQLGARLALQVIEQIQNGTVQGRKQVQPGDEGTEVEKGQRRQ